MKPNIIDDREKFKNQIPTKTVNEHRFVAVHYKGVTADVTGLYGGGRGGHFDIKHNGEIHQNADITATIWAVGAPEPWVYIHPVARNQNTISIEANCYCDGNSSSIYDPKWYFTNETQESMAQTAAWLLFDVLGYPLTKQTIESYLLRHGDITTKPCPNPYFASVGYKTNWGWEKFKSRVLEIGVNDRKGSDYMFDVKQIKKGDRSADVELWQRILFSNKLKGKDGKQIAIDGIFGDNTDFATRNFQKANKDAEGKALAVDGIVGPKTWASGLGV